MVSSNGSSFSAPCSKHEAPCFVCFRFHNNDIFSREKSRARIGLRSPSSFFIHLLLSLSLALWFRCVNSSISFTQHPPLHCLQNNNTDKRRKSKQSWQHFCVQKYGRYTFQKLIFSKLAARSSTTTSVSSFHFISQPKSSQFTGHTHLFDSCCCLHPNHHKKSQKQDTLTNTNHYTNNINQSWAELPFTQEHQPSRLQQRRTLARSLTTLLTIILTSSIAVTTAGRLRTGSRRRSARWRRFVPTPSRRTPTASWTPTSPPRWASRSIHARRSSCMSRTVSEKSEGSKAKVSCLVPGMREECRCCVKATDSSLSSSISTHRHIRLILHLSINQTIDDLALRGTPTSHIQIHLLQYFFYNYLQRQRQNQDFWEGNLPNQTNQQQQNKKKRSVNVSN